MHNSQATAMHFMILCFELELVKIVPTLLLQTSLLMSPIASSTSLQYPPTAVKGNVITLPVNLEKSGLSVKFMQLVSRESYCVNKLWINFFSKN